MNGGSAIRRESCFLEYAGVFSHDSDAVDEIYNLYFKKSSFWAGPLYFLELIALSFPDKKFFITFSSKRSYPSG